MMYYNRLVTDGDTNTIYVAKSPSTTKTELAVASLYLRCASAILWVVK